MSANSGIQTVRDQEGVSGSQPSSSGVAPPGNQPAQGHGPQAGRLASARKPPRKATWRKRMREIQAAKKASAVGEGPSREPTRKVRDRKVPRYDATCWIPPNTEESMKGKLFTEAEDRNILDWLRDNPRFDPHEPTTWLVMASHGRWPVWPALLEIVIQVKSSGKSKFVRCVGLEEAISDVLGKDITSGIMLEGMRPVFKGVGSASARSGSIFPDARQKWFQNRGRSARNDE